MSKTSLNEASALAQIIGPNCCPRPGCHTENVGRTEEHVNYDEYQCNECGQRWRVGWEVVMDMCIIKEPA